MIKRFTDHAANERTYLAWIRTALAFMGFGLLLERFDLLVRSLPDATGVLPEASGTSSVTAAGLVLILFGVIVIAISTRRYFHFRGRIALEEEEDFRSSRTDLGLSIMVGAIAIFMVGYVIAQTLG